MDRGPLDHGRKRAGRGSLSAQDTTGPRPQIGGESTDLSRVSSPAPAAGEVREGEAEERKQKRQPWP